MDCGEASGDHSGILQQISGKKADKRKVESCKKVEKSAAVYKEKAQKKKVTAPRKRRIIFL